MLIGHDVGRVIDNKSVVPLGSPLLGEHSFWNRSKFGVDTGTLRTNAVARSFGGEFLPALKADALCRIVLAYLHFHVE